MRMPDPLFATIALAALLLVAATAGGSLTTPIGRRLREAEVRVRIRMGWWVIGGFLLALFVGRTPAVIAVGLLSFVAFKEFLTLARTRRADNKVLLWAYLTIPLQYFWAGTGNYGLFIVFIPVYAFLLLPMRMVLMGESEGFLRAVGVIHWGLMTTVFSLSHLAFLLVLPDLPEHRNTGVALLLYVVLLTQLNDAVRQFVDARHGRRPLLSRVHPTLTREGVAAGIGATIVAAMLTAPLYTPFTAAHAAVAGFTIALFGFVGFVTITAVERDLGVAESRDFLPGHGGLLLRLDSLMFTAPLFFHFVFYLHY
jgi:phosphatidate cytidylyltransferase